MLMSVENYESLATGKMAEATKYLNVDNVEAAQAFATLALVYAGLAQAAATQGTWT
jgi:hypothetical protein